MAELESSAVVGRMARYDAQVKRVFAQKAVLARILKGTMRELHDVEASEVEGLIEGEALIDAVPVGPGWTAPAIRGGPAEDDVPGEGSVRFDILTHVRLPRDAGSARVIVNLEAQRAFWPGYEIVTRGVYYAARLVSSQLGVEFDHSHYGDVKKVYSIWVCMDATARVANSMAAYSLAKRDLLGSQPDNPAAYDKIEVVVVALSQKAPTDDAMIGMLNTLLSGELTRDEKLRAMEREYNMHVTNDLAEGVSAMSNLWEIPYEKGMEKGAERGRAEGEERGIAKGEERSRMQLVADNLKRGMSYEEIARFLGATVDEVKALEQKGLQPA